VVNRYREFRADAGGARLAGREKMIAALERLRLSLDQPHLPDQLAAFGISAGSQEGLEVAWHACSCHTHPWMSA
jgi:heat shock protein HtpX